MRAPNSQAPPHGPTFRFLFVMILTLYFWVLWGEAPLLLLLQEVGGLAARMRMLPGPECAGAAVDCLAEPALPIAGPQGLEQCT